MKRLTILLGGIVMALTMSAQIMLTPYVEATVGGLDQNNSDLLINKLRSCISAAGMESAYNSRFVLASNVNVLGRSYTATAPVQMVQELSVTMAIGDGISGTCFGSCTFEVKGIGRTEEEAMISAFKNLPRTNSKIKEMVTTSRERIIDYYERNAANIIALAKSYVVKQQYEEALWELSAIPQECSRYPEAVAMMEKVYTANINHDAAQILAQAQAVWSSDPYPGPAADEATRLLGMINTDAACYPQAQALMKTIANRVQSVTDRRYDDAVAFRNAQLQAATTLEKARIKSARAVAVAYANSRPRTVYHVHSWW